MGTNNPKVSAYVPQPIKDRLTQFREERRLSESQAVSVILAEYFQMEQSIDRSGKEGQVGGVTLYRMEALEEKLANVVASVEHRLQQLREEIGKISGLPVAYQVTLESVVSGGEQHDSSPSEPLTISQEPEQVVTAGDEQDSSLSDELLNEPLDQKDNKSNKSEELQEVDSSVLLGELLAQEEKEDEVSEVSQELDSSNLSGGSASELSVENAQPEQIPLNLGAKEDSARIGIDLLALRLERAANSVRNKKSKLSDEEFTEWTATKDINKIGWNSIKEGNRVYYEPATVLSGELLNELLIWIRKNRS